MQQTLRNIKDECSRCENFLECELCRQGHGVKQERTNIANMVKCQTRHRQRLERKYEG